MAKCPLLTFWRSLEFCVMTEGQPWRQQFCQIKCWNC
ncbi:putative signal peptide protein [Puccinia sorghi]|uniref:Putative signal peptide protein n=1 Tax=Puccinia sorghi TaxID=27349 RepID=A0A0L6V3D6_9BASI|nr:putative signal peptide protein [Puccinia sorghi]